MMLNADREYSTVTKSGRTKIIMPASGVCRLRVGICPGERGVTMDERQADRMVDVLAMQETALRQIPFLGQPLGAAGAAVALRQAKQLRLDLPAYTHFHGRRMHIFIRADVVSDYMAGSPTLAKLLTIADEEVAAPICKSGCPAPDSPQQVLA